MFKNDEQCSKMFKNDLKMFKNDLKCSKMFYSVL